MGTGYRILSVEAADVYKAEQENGVAVGYKLPAQKGDGYFRLFKNKKGERRFLCYNSNNGHGRKGSICGRRIILRHTLTAMTRS